MLRGGVVRRGGIGVGRGLGGRKSFTVEHISPGLLNHLARKASICIWSRAGRARRVKPQHPPPP